MMPLAADQETVGWAAVAMAAVALLSTFIGNITANRKAHIEAENAREIERIKAEHSAKIIELQLKLEFCEQQHKSAKENYDRAIRRIEALESRDSKSRDST